MPPELLPGSPGSPPDLERLSARLETLTVPVFARLGFAAVTSSGLRSYRNHLAEIFDEPNGETAWLIGLYHGITQPAALRQLLSMGSGLVRVFAAGATGLRYEILSQPPQFHAKALCFTGTEEENSGYLYVSSANLTGAAYGQSSQNIELGLLVELTPSLLRVFDEWWASSWGRSLDLTADLIDGYAELRHEFLQRNPELPHGAELPPAEDVREANFLWIETGAMSGGARNQVEFNRELAWFFGEPADERRDLTIVIEGNQIAGRPLTPKTTTFGVDIWRLGLPTADQGAPSYPDRVILLAKETRNAEQVFKLEIADAGSEQHREWISLSSRYGHVGQTSGQRQFGFFARPAE